jgi:hypothetical protein
MPFEDIRAPKFYQMVLLNFLKCDYGLNSCRYSNPELPPMRDFDSLFLIRHKFAFVIGYSCTRVIHICFGEKSSFLHFGFWFIPRNKFALHILVQKCYTCQDTWRALFGTKFAQLCCKHWYSTASKLIDAARAVRSLSAFRLAFRTFGFTLFTEPPRENDADRSPRLPARRRRRPRCVHAD